MAMIYVNTVAIPSPSSFSVKLEDERKTIKTASGRMVTDIIGTNRRTLDFNYKHLTQAQAAALLTALSATDTLSVTYPDPITGTSRTSVFLISDNRGLKGHAVYSSGMPWLDFAFSLEEVEI